MVKIIRLIVEGENNIGKPKILNKFGVIKFLIFVNVIAILDFSLLPLKSFHPSLLPFRFQFFASLLIALSIGTLQ